MHANNLLVDEPIRMSTILDPSKPSSLPAMTKSSARLAQDHGRLKPFLLVSMPECLGRDFYTIISRNRCFVKPISISVARFDFSSGDVTYHQETVDNLTAAIQSTKKLCAVMLDTVGPELHVVNRSGRAIPLEMNSFVVLTPDQEKEASSKLLPINFHGLSKATSIQLGYYSIFKEVVKPGKAIFIGQYLFTGNETTLIWLEVVEVKGDDVVCLIKNSSTLDGSLYTLHVSQIHIDLPTLTDADKKVISTWGAQNNIDFLSLSYVRHAEDIRQARNLLSKLGRLHHCQIYAKIENIEGITHFDEILQEADGIIVSRGNLGIDLPPEKVFLFQKYAVSKCNIAGKPAVITRVVDSMTDTLRPTRAEATDVANAVLDGCDAILLGAETLRGLYPVEAISTVGKICAEVRAAIKVRASVIIVFTTSGRAARLIAKYKPTMPVLSVVIPQLKTNQLCWSITGAFEARQSLIVRGVIPVLAGPGHDAKSTDESILKFALDHGKASGLTKPHDRVVVFQKVGEASVVKIIELEE
ncbi:hypothetical protein HPP92_011882 [Vanilla planifolia]|uniref:Pyruvate kinase n=2 Tax=Vanilla planifolia TaxID=51239 RepID=A0A835QYG4_VANPL|nr:hypothetical protein HPP92_011882 [Vanilla planifolia]